MSAYAATPSDLTTLMDNLSNAGVPDEVITITPTRRKQFRYRRCVPLVDEMPSEAESDAEFGLAGAWT